MDEEKEKAMKTAARTMENKFQWKKMNGELLFTATHLRSNLAATTAE